jgi:hypothetical protein
VFLRIEALQLRLAADGNRSLARFLRRLADVLSKKKLPLKNGSRSRPICSQNA